jgi:hypothetical protein
MWKRQSDVYWEQQPGEGVHNERKKLTKTETEKDLNVHISGNLKPTRQCRKVATKSTQVLNQILRNFHYCDKRAFVGLHKMYLCQASFGFRITSLVTLVNRRHLTHRENPEKALKSVAGLKGMTLHR